jgi:SAM-dependent methyltransferase
MRRLYKRLPKPPSTNYHLPGLDLDPYDLVPSGGVVLDLGAGDLGGAYAFATRPVAERRLRRIALDFCAGQGVHVRADAHTIPMRDESVDAVLCVSVLEYVTSPQQVVAECMRVLKPGGVLYISAPFVFPHHPPPDDHFRFSMSGLRALACGCTPLRVGFNRGPASTFCHILVHFIAITGSCGSRRLYGVLLDAAKWGFFWVKYLDRWIGRYETAAVLHGSAYFLGRKKGLDAQVAR